MKELTQEQKEALDRELYRKSMLAAMRSHALDYRRELLGVDKWMWTEETHQESLRIQLACAKSYRDMARRLGDFSPEALKKLIEGTVTTGNL